MNQPDPKQEIESAFSPLKCVAKYEDHNNYITFVVYGDSGDRLYESEIPGRIFTDPERLRHALNAARQHLEKRDNGPRQ